MKVHLSLENNICVNCVTHFSLLNLYMNSYFDIYLSLILENNYKCKIYQKIKCNKKMNYEIVISNKNTPCLLTKNTKRILLLKINKKFQAF